MPETAARTIGAGRLRKVLKIESPSMMRDSFGQPTEVWTLVVVTRGEILEASASEKFSAGHFSAQVSHTILVRYRASVPMLAGMRARSGSKVYLVQAVSNVEERNRLVKMLCLEQPSG